MTQITTPIAAATLPQTSAGDGAAVLLDQLAAYVAELRQLDAADWARPTDCPEWTVRHMAAHVAGALDEGAHLLVLTRHLWTAKMRGGPLVDALNACQVAARANRSGPELVDEIERLAEPAARKRRRTPGFIRRRPVPGDDLRPGSTFAYLFDVVYARDVWMHRVDTARATGRPLAAADGDAEVVGQVVHDLARDWPGPALLLDLSGACAGRWLIGAGDPVATVRTDSREYLRLLSGRSAEPRLEVEGDPTAAHALLDARVTF